MQPHPRYQLLEKIGSGSFATVYRGRDVELGRDVAIKQIHEQYLADPQQLERYWQEAQLLASFQHPNIVTIYDIVRDRGWLIMELMQGNLAKVSGRKPMDLNALRTMLAHCLRALKFLHSHGIIHGDIKPGNIMIDRRKRVKIGDFGLARRASDEQGSLIKGTTKYMAPEVVSDEFGEVGPPSDLYSLGFAAYELMCGENFESLFPGLSAFGRDKQMAWMMWHAAPDRRLPEIKRVLEGVPDDIAKVVQKLTAKSQSERYSTADEALSDLNIDVKVVKAGGESGEVAAGPPTDDAKRKRLLTIGAFAASMLLCMLMLFMPSGSKPPEANDNPAITGVVREVFVDKRKVEIEDEQGVPQEIAVGEKPRIHLNEENYIPLRELKKGDRVEITRETDASGTTIVKMIALRPEQSRGAIKIVRPADSELVLEDTTLREDVPLRVPQGAKVFLNGKPVALSDLHTGDRAEALHLKDAQGRASRVAIRIDVLRIVQMTGFVEQIEVDKNRMLVRQRGGGAQLVTLEFAEKCRVTVNGAAEADGKAFTPADLHKGDRVVLTLDTRVSAVVASRRQRLSGTLVDLRDGNETKSISIQPDSGPRRAFNIGTDCEITLSREPAQFGDLRNYDTIDITFDAAENGAGEVRTLDAVRQTKPDRYAIVIGVQNYADRAVSRLPYPLDDAKLIRETFIKRYAFAPERILFLTDPDRGALQQQIPEWLKKTSNLTQVIVYYNGHAYTDDAGRVYLAPRDVALNKLAETGLPLDWLAGELEACIAREKMLLLDACHAGTGADLERQPATEDMLRTIAAGASSKLKSAAAIGSCRKGERGQDWPAKLHGVFAWELAAGFAGPADKDRDLVIDVKELFDYLVTHMPRPSMEGQPPQTPVLFSPPC